MAAFVLPADIEKARRQITSHAHSHAPPSDAEDLAQSALTEALEHYNEERGKFPTFAFLVYKRILSTYYAKRNRRPNPHRDLRLRKDIDNLEVARLYLRGKLTLAGIAAIMRCDPVTIMKRLETMGIPRRPTGIQGGRG